MRDKLAELLGIDVRSLALFRMGLAGILLADLVIRATDLTAHYTDAGVFPRSAMAEYYGSRWYWSLHAAAGSLFSGAVLFGVAAIAAVCLAVGYSTRIATCLSWLLLTSLHLRNPLVINAGDTLLRVLLFWSMFLPLGWTWSLDAARRARPLPGVQRLVGVSTACILLQVCLMYWMTAYFKLNDVWRGGEALYYVVSFDAYARPLAATLARHDTLMAFLSRLTLWGELLAPILVFSPIGTSLLRAAVIGFFVLLHAGIEMTMTVGLFSYVCLVAWILFLPTPMWEAICRRGMDPAPAAKPAPGAGWAWFGSVPSSAAVSAFFLLVLLWNISTAGSKGADAVLRGGLRKIAEVTMLMQKWSMFDRPASRDGWCVLAARLANGRQVDLRQGGAPLRWDRPASIVDLSPNHRWRKYYLNVLRERNRPLRSLLCRFLARQWDRSHSAEEAVTAVDLYFLEERTMPPGQPPRTAQRLLHHEPIRPQGAFLEALEDSAPAVETELPGI